MRFRTIFACVALGLVAGSANATSAVSQPCHVCRKVVTAARSLPKGGKATETTLRLQAFKACDTDAARNTPVCANVEQLASAVVKHNHVSSAETCAFLGQCSVSELSAKDGCGGVCQNADQCGPGCYCNGWGQCDDSCFPACQGESQFCPPGCGCGDYGFCDAGSKKQ